MENNYFTLLKRLRDLKRKYPSLTIEEKLNVLALELKIEGKNIKQSKTFLSKAEKESLKTRKNQQRKKKEK